MQAEAKKSKPVVMPESIGLAEYKRHDWIVDIDPDFTLEDIIEPSFWAHVAFQMEPMDKIEARWEDGSQIANLRVRFCERTYAKVSVINVEKYEDVADVPASSLLHTIEWKGPRLKFSVIRNSDRAMIQNGFKERAQASAWLTEHERT